MSLLTKEVLVGIVGSSVSRYEKLGYGIPKQLNKKGKLVSNQKDKLKVKVFDLPSFSKIKVESKCDCCGLVSFNTWADYLKQVKDEGKTYCRKCGNKIFAGDKISKTKLGKGMSLDKWCVENNRYDILDLWDYSLNKCSPSNINYGTNKDYWFKCSNDTAKSRLLNIKRIRKSNNDYMISNEAKSIAQWGIQKYGSKFLTNCWDLDKNQLDPWKLKHGSHQKVWIKCINCGNLKLISPHILTRYGIACPKCSDGISYPNKIMFSILEQLSIDFETEKKFKWCEYLYKNKYRKGAYDFYFELDNIKYIVEMDGGFHYRDTNSSNKIDIQFIDAEKDKLALDHEIEIIRIDSNISDLGYIKANILKSRLHIIFNLSLINWKQCNEHAYKSLIKSACDLWNENKYTTVQISNILRIHSCTTVRYLKKCNAQGWCEYDTEKELLKSNNNKKRKVYCVELEKIFNGITEASKILNINGTSISLACSGVQLTAGNYHWKYYDDYLKNHYNVE